MFEPRTYIERRNRLKKKVESGVVLLLGNMEVGMNYDANPYPFRQDSNFLYFVGIDQPGLAAIIDIEENKTIVFGDDLSLDDVVWKGAQPSISELASEAGVSETAPFSNLTGELEAALKKGRTVHFLPPYRSHNMLRLNDWLGVPVDGLKAKASEKLIKAVVEQRACKSAGEVEEMEKAVAISGAMHVAAMRAAQEGQKEAQIAGIVEGIAIGMGGNLSYPIILSINGQTLHNHFHGNALSKGKLVLGDFGAETTSHYAGDITRTFPVDQQFTQKQKEVYQLVLETEVRAIESLKPGLAYLDVHLAAAKQIAEGLKSLGLMKGDMDQAVAEGAHALFFPHGLGHMIGLDVHDMEDLGEDFVGYSTSVQRSSQFGLAYLRLARALQPGFVLTVEPGIYFIPELIDQWKAKNQFTDFINYEKVEKYRHFGGIRVEDNVVITATGHRILGNPIPKTIEEVEALRKA